MRLITPPGVFRPRSDAWLLVEAMRERGLAAGRTVLDVFTGSGAISVAAAMAGAGSVTAVDVSRRAVGCARFNARLNGVRVRALCGDLFDPVAGERFDLITANPPYLPGAAALPASGASRAWEGGRDGRVLLDRFCRAAPSLLAGGGTLLVVQSEIADIAKTVEQLRAAGLKTTVVARHHGPIGPLVQSRATALEAAGTLARGAREEQLAVIYASRASGL